MQFPGPLKNIMRGGRGGEQSGGPTAAEPARQAFPQRNAPTAESVSTRQSRGLEEFFNYIRGQSGLTILYLGGATQQNVSFITNLGHRLYSENFLQILSEAFGADDTV